MRTPPTADSAPEALKYDVANHFRFGGNWAAFYLETRFCGWWRMEKRLFSRLGPRLQALLPTPFAGLSTLRLSAAASTRFDISATTTSSGV